MAGTKIKNSSYTHFLNKYGLCTYCIPHEAEGKKIEDPSRSRTKMAASVF